jgi:hypothetical protein
VGEPLGRPAEPTVDPAHRVEIIDPASAITECPNCGSELVRRYCPDCGQKAPRPDDYSLREHAADFVDQVASFDGRIARTLWTLLSRPGALTIAHLAGRRARYLRPLQLFLIVNVLLFVAAPRVPMFSYSLDNYLENSPPSPTLTSRLVQRHAHVGVIPDSYATAFDKRVEAQRKSLIILFVPALALVLHALFSWRPAREGVPRRYGEHLVFSLHVLAFVWLVMTGWGVLAALSFWTTARLADLGVLGAIVALFALTPAYVLFATQRVYRLSPGQALVATIVLGGAFTALLIAYRVLLFFTTLLTL